MHDKFDARNQQTSGKRAGDRAGISRVQSSANSGRAGPQSRGLGPAQLAARSFSASTLSLSAIAWSVMFRATRSKVRAVFKYSLLSIIGSAINLLELLHGIRLQLALPFWGRH